MADDVGDSYDSMAELYATLDHRIDRIPSDREWFDKFVQVAATGEGTIADFGCGPGHVVNELSELGLAAVGYDISPGQVAQANLAFPDLEFHVGNIAAPDIDVSAFGGIVSRYSIIHMLPERLAGTFTEWFGLLESGAPLLVSFFAAPSAEAHGSPFDHAVVTAYALFPVTIAEHLQDAGFESVEIGMRGPLEGERALDHATVLAVKPNAATVTFSLPDWANSDQ